jgi:hypothetical protein
MITDDGSITLYSSYFDQDYEDVLSGLSQLIFEGDGYSCNKRHSGIFTDNKEEVGTPMCPGWNNVPKRYIYQPFPHILFQLREVAQIICSEVIDHELTQAIVNKYTQSDFISFHKDYHEPGTEPVAVICSFEKNPSAKHVLEFYRTVEDKENPYTVKKERTSLRHEFEMELGNFSVAVMVGMQTRYAHSIKKQNENGDRISVVFR